MIKEINVKQPKPTDASLCLFRIFWRSEDFRVGWDIGGIAIKPCIVNTEEYCKWDGMLNILQTDSCLPINSCSPKKQWKCSGYGLVTPFAIRLPVLYHSFTIYPTPPIIYPALSLHLPRSPHCYRVKQASTAPKGTPGWRVNRERWDGTVSPAFPGTAGRRGEDGVSGLPGSDGFAGYDGPPGEQGLSGLPGLRGEDGNRGRDGLSGLPGRTGSVGT